MKLNKRRTLVTIIGIVISVAMITAVSTIAYSIMDFLARDAMADNGYFHLKFSNYYYKDNDIIVSELDAEDYALMKPLGDYTYERPSVEEGSNDEVPAKIELSPYGADLQEGDVSAGIPKAVNATRLVAVEDKFFDMASIVLSEGEYPKNDTEVLLSSRMSEVYQGVLVGDTITIGDKEYTVSGIIGKLDFESIYLSLPNAAVYPIYTVFDRDTLQSDDIVSGYFYAGGTLDNLEEKAEKLQTKLGQSGVPEHKLIGDDETWYCDGVGYSYNYRVLTYLGLSQYSNVNYIMDTFKLILIAIVMVGSVSLIANGFIISISERSRYLGMLASVGATKKQKRSSVYFEGFFEGIIAIPFGILAGIGGIAITFELISPLVRELSGSTEELRVVVNNNVIIWTVVFSVLTIFLSAYFPARRASKISAIEAIRQSKDIKLTSRTVRTMGITRRIFGFEGELALKNLKRNKKRYRVTVFSMFISLTLFISVYSLVYYMKESVYFDMGEVGHDIAITTFSSYSMNSEAEEENSAYEDKFVDVTDKLLIKGSKYIDASQRYMSVGFYNGMLELQLEFMEDYYNSEFWKFMNTSDLTYPGPDITLVSMNEEDLKGYLESIGISYEEFVADKDNVILFDGMKYNVYTEEERLVYFGDVLNSDLKALSYSCVLYELKEVMGDDGHVYEEFVETGKEDMNFNIYSREEKFMGLSQNSMYMLITPEKVRELGEYGAFVDYHMILDVNNDKKTVELFEDLSQAAGYDESEYYINNYAEEVYTMENSMLLVSIFVYGFIILMSLICAANIVNTISTSLALRRKEFAMLKSVGMTDRAFNKMIAYESAFYGIKAVIFGLPVGTAVMLLIRNLMADTFIVELGIPWMGYVIAIIGVFVVIGVTMLYSSRKIKKANVIEALRDDNA